MKARQVAIFGLIAVVLGLMPFGQGVAADLLPPQLAIQEASAKMQEKMQDKSFTKDFAKINQFVNDTIYPHTDFDRVSELVLGRIWKAATADERQRFKHEFQTMLVRVYSRAFIDFKDWSVRFLPLEMEDGARKVIVRTEVLQPGIRPIGVSYRMLLSAGEWKAYDIMIEGVSLVTNYRSSFANEVQTKGSLNAVIEGMVKRNAEALAAKPAENS